ncbi:zinc finger protein 180-like isoform X2 [Dendronephthya gigantea]|uniref:zinc finger protein 180-like isoform X2 n=1 Tax=Dendronephthya gigantea TaxID=151771 RepID=UPI00106CBB81|nr:zinc finger protein 180-like isoform X2 [Dendronephthya gigantea]
MAAHFMQNTWALFVKIQLKGFETTFSIKSRMECGVCSKTFSTRGNLVRHKRTHTGIKPYKCDICEGRFFRSSHLEEHKITHTGEKPFQCDVCNKKFTRSGHLIVHKKTHSVEKPYECGICKQRFSLMTDLADHKNKHAEEKYECDICHQVFTQSGAITRHRRIHTGEKPYKCDICQQTFARANSLRRHSLTHTGEKPYKCDVCQERFSRSSNLARHMIRKHSKEKKTESDVSNHRQYTSPKIRLNEAGKYECETHQEKNMCPPEELRGSAKKDSTQTGLCNIQLPDCKCLMQHIKKECDISYGQSHQIDVCSEELQLKTQLTNIGKRNRKQVPHCFSNILA